MFNYQIGIHEILISIYKKNMAIQKIICWTKFCCLIFREFISHEILPGHKSSS